MTARHGSERKLFYLSILLVAAFNSGQRHSVHLALVSISRHRSTLSLYKQIFFLEDGSKNRMKSETVVLIRLF